MLADVAGDVAAALDVVDDLAAGHARQDILGEEHQLAVRIDDLAVLGDHPETVAVAVEGQADLRIGLAQATDEVLKVLGMRRIRMVVGEVAIDLAEELDHLAAEAPIELGGEGSGHAVAAVDRDLHRPGELHVPGDPAEIGLAQVGRAGGTGRDPRQASLEAIGDDAVIERPDGVAVERLARDHHLQAVVFGRIMAACDRHTRTGAELVGGVVDDRRGHHPDVDRIETRPVDALGQGGDQRRPGEPAVAADHDRLHPLLAGGQAERRTDLAHHGLGQGLAHDAADVVRLEDGLRWNAGIDH